MNQFQWNSRSIVNNLIMMNAVIFLAQYLSPFLDSILITYLGLHNFQSELFYPHQLVTYMFLHGGVSHLFFNMFSLWMFGRSLEYDLGSKRFLTFYMLTGIGAGLLNMLVGWVEMDITNNPDIVNSVTFGASGAIYGVLAAFGIMHPNDRIMLLFPPIPMKAKYLVIIFAVIELFYGFTINDGVAHFAHLGGMLFGYIILKYWKAKGKIYF